MKVSGYLWAAWFLGSLVVFGILETIALFNKVPNDTLTATIVRDIRWYVALAALVAAVILAVGHWYLAYHSHAPMRGHL